MRISMCASSILFFVDGDTGIVGKECVKGKRFLSQDMQFCYFLTPRSFFYILLCIIGKGTCTLYFSNSQLSFQLFFFLVDWKVEWSKKLLVLPSGSSFCSDSSTNSGWWVSLPRFLLTAWFPQQPSQGRGNCVL